MYSEDRFVAERCRTLWNGKERHFGKGWGSAVDNGTDGVLDGFFCLVASHTSAGPTGRVRRDRESYLAPHTPLLLERIPVCCVGVINLSSDMESCHAQITCHGETQEMD